MGAPVESASVFNDARRSSNLSTGGRRSRRCAKSYTRRTLRSRKHADKSVRATRDLFAEEGAEGAEKICIRRARVTDGALTAGIPPSRENRSAGGKWVVPPGLESFVARYPALKRGATGGSSLRDWNLPALVPSCSPVGNSSPTAGALRQAQGGLYSYAASRLQRQPDDPKKEQPAEKRTARKLFSLRAARWTVWD